MNHGALAGAQAAAAAGTDQGLCPAREGLDGRETGALTQAANLAIVTPPDDVLNILQSIPTSSQIAGTSDVSRFR